MSKPQLLNHIEWEYIPYGALDIEWGEIQPEEYKADPIPVSGLTYTGNKKPTIYVLRTLRRDELTIAQREAYAIFKGDLQSYTKSDNKNLFQYADNPVEIMEVLWFWICKFAILQIKNANVEVSKERRYMRDVLTDESVMAIDSIVRQWIADEILRMSTLSEMEKKQ